MTSPPLARWLPWGLLALLPWAAWTARLAWVCDDAWISFRYGRNWAEGHGPVYNLDGSPPVEGYSDLLWVVLAAGATRVGLAPEVVLPAISACCGALVVLGVARTAAVLGAPTAGVVAACGVVGLSPAMGAWSTGGLETMPTTLALGLVAERLWVAKDLRGALLAACALSLLRVEGPAWALLVAALGGVGWGSSDDRRQLRRHAAAVGGAVVLVVAVHTAWRLSFYGDWVANTARAKVAWGPDRLGRGALYVIGTWANLPSLIVPALALPWVPWGPGRNRALGVLALAVPGYAVTVGGDYMAFGRLLVLGLPLLGVLVGLGTRHASGAALLLALATVGSLPGVDVQLAPRGVRQALQWRNSYPKVDTELGMWSFMNDNVHTWARQGRMLAAATHPDESLVTGAIGARGYFSHLTILDRGGLVSREPNRAPPTASVHRVSPGHDRTVPRTFFLPQRPDYLDFAVEDPTRGMPVLLREARRLEGYNTPGYGPRAHKVAVDGTERIVLLLARAADLDEAKAWRDDLGTHLEAVTAGPATPVRTP